MDTWFTVASCVYLGCPFERPPPVSDHVDSATSFATIQFKNLATSAPWLDLTQEGDCGVEMLRLGCFQGPTRGGDEERSLGDAVSDRRGELYHHRNRTHRGYRFVLFQVQKGSLKCGLSLGRRRVGSGERRDSVAGRRQILPAPAPNQGQ